MSGKEKKFALGILLAIFFVAAVASAMPLSMQYEKAHSAIAQPKALPQKPQKLVIIIDPGHGGNDPGAISESGLNEKNITLQYARSLRALLAKDGRYKVFLTRNKDIYVGLKERTIKARDLHADLFISLHADTNPEAKVRGLSVYTLSSAAAADEIEKLDNQPDKASVLGHLDLSHENSDAKDVVIDLVQSENRNASAKFAEIAVHELGGETKLLQHSHRFAGFVVLTGIDVPSVLIELGYLSNKYEEKMLIKPDYRKKLVKALAHSVDVYFRQ